MIQTRDIPSAVTDREISVLMELAKGKVVLELGAQYGFSTVWLGQSALKLYSVDWHFGDSMAGQSSSLESYFSNLNRYGLRDRVASLVGRFEDILPLFGKHLFDGIFLDGLHDRESIERDTDLAWPLLKPGGWFAWHDWNRFDVTAVVQQWVNEQSVELEVVDHLAWTHKL